MPDPDGLGEPRAARPEAVAEAAYAACQKALPGVGGLVGGRTMRYRARGDVAAAVDAAAGLVHGTAR